MLLENRFTFLLEVKEVLDKAGVPFWIDFGTFLGFYRDGDFLETDPDIDIGIKREDQNKVVKVVDELKKLGEVVARVDMAEKHYLAGYKIIRDDVDGNDFWIDIAFYFRCEHRYLWPISQWPKVMIFSENYFNNLEEIEIRGVKFKIPHDPEDCLELHYGKDWRRPFKRGEDYDLHKCTNIENNKPYLKYLV